LLTLFIYFLMKTLQISITILIKSTFVKEKIRLLIDSGSPINLIREDVILE